MSAPLLKVEDLRVTFNIRREGDMPWTPPRSLHAVGGVNFTLQPGERAIGLLEMFRSRTAGKSF